MRTIVCEVARQQRLPAMFGERARAGEIELSPGLFTLSIDPDQAVEEYLQVQMGSRTLAGFLSHNRLFELLATATPGLRELVTVGKVWDLAQTERKTSKAKPYDLVVVDAPATGHGLALLRAPRTFRDATRVGPISRQAGIIDAFLTDRERTAVVAVALAEEMPVNETLELGATLDADMGMVLSAVVANGIYPQRFSAAEAGQVEVALDGGGATGSKLAGTALRAAASEHRRARGQRNELRRLRDRAGRLPGKPEVAALPFIFEPDLRAEAIERLSRELERRL